MARPDMIDQTYVDKAQRYLDKELWLVDGDVIPTVEGLAKYLNVSRQTCYEAAELSYTLEQVQREQARKVINKSITGEYNSNIAKLLLSSKHGYVEKAQVDQTSSDGSMSPKEPASQSTLDDYVKYLKDKTAKDAE